MNKQDFIPTTRRYQGLKPPKKQRIECHLMSLVFMAGWFWLSAFTPVLANLSNGSVLNSSVSNSSVSNSSFSKSAVASDSLRFDSSTYETCIRAIGAFYDDFDPELRVELELVCPQVYTLFKQNPLLAHLQSFSLSDIHHIARLVYLPEQTQVMSWSADPQRLDEILSETWVVRNQEKKDWWDMFIHWLKGQVDSDQNVSYDWLDNLLANIEKLTEYIQAFVYISLGLSALFLLWLIYSELKMAGFFIPREARKGQARLRNGFGASGLGTEVQLLELSDIQQLPLQQQPKALLIFCIERLIRAKRLPENRSYTYRELVGYLNHFSAIESFKRLVGVVESSEYGKVAIDHETVNACYQYQNTIIEGNQTE